MADLSRRELFRRLTGRTGSVAPATEADTADSGQDAESGRVEPTRRDLTAKLANRRCRNAGRPCSADDP